MKNFKNEKGSTLIGSLILITTLAYIGVVMSQLTSSDMEIGTNEIQSVQATQVGNAGIQYALDKINQGQSADVENQGFGPGTFTVTTNPNTPEVIVTANVGKAKKVQSLEAFFAQQCNYTDATTVQINGNEIENIEVVKTCNDIAMLSDIQVTWNWSVCAQNIGCTADEVDNEGEDNGTIICHSPPGNSNSAHTITIGSSALSAHLNHGDSTGACDSSNSSDDSSSDNSSNDDNSSDDSNSDDNSSNDNSSNDDSSSDDDSSDDNSNDNSNKVTICHIPPGNPDAAHSITIGSPALSAHLAHGDTQGGCNGEAEDEEVDAIVCEGFSDDIEICGDDDGGATVDSITINGTSIGSNLEAQSGDIIDVTDYQMEADQAYFLDIGFSTTPQFESYYEVTLYFTDGSEITQSFMIGENPNEEAEDDNSNDDSSNDDNSNDDNSNDDSSNDDNSSDDSSNDNSSNDDSSSDDNSNDNSSNDDNSSDDNSSDD